MTTRAQRRPQETPAGGWRGVVALVYGQRRRTATVAAIALAAGVGYHVIFGQNGLTAFQGKRDDARTLSEQAAQLTEENERLKRHVDRLASDPGAIEHQAREQLHYTRANEVIVNLPNETPSTRPVGLK